MFFELVRPGTRFDFLARRRLWAGLSIGALAICALAIPLRGVRLGVDFAGGTELQVRVRDRSADEGAVRGALRAGGLPAADVIRVGGGGESVFLVRLPLGAGDAESASAPVQRALAAGIGDVEIERVEFVGPRVGDDLRRGAFLSMAVAFALIGVYMAFRFQLRFVPGALLAVVHDAALAAGAFVVLGLELDLGVVAGLLTVVGYSLNDTIVIYDRIRENLAMRGAARFSEVVNASINQTLSRTLLTSGTTLLAALALLLLGGSEIFSFALTMTIGIVVGTYSSIYVAAPLLLALYGEAGAARPARREAAHHGSGAGRADRA
ncbi:MAG TPA: protein translocase subunit SecF [Candidatus Limnocylindrales bacterium]|nr:protein translocase subunit SecF [Candidatus Limnocylindrales bacterium]